jgi:hypothetical protein
MGRVARIVALVVILVGLVAQPAWAAPPLPSSMAAIGDSITRAYVSCLSLALLGQRRGQRSTLFYLRLPSRWTLPHLRYLPGQR